MSDDPFGGGTTYISQSNLSLPLSLSLKLSIQIPHKPYKTIKNYSFDKDSLSLLGFHERGGAAAGGGGGSPGVFGSDRRKGREEFDMV